MNMKMIYLFLVIGAFALGAVVGAYVIHRSESGKASVGDTPLLTSRLTVDVGTDVAYLYRLRDGRTDVVRNVLEMQVDSDLVMLSERIAALPITERDPDQLKTIQMYKDYRKKFPYTNRVSSISEGVFKAYTLLGDTSNEKK